MLRGGIPGGIPGGIIGGIPTGGIMEACQLEGLVQEGIADVDAAGVAGGGGDTVGTSGGVGDAGALGLGHCFGVFCCENAAQPEGFEGFLSFASIFCRFRFSSSIFDIAVVTRFPLAASFSHFSLCAVAEAMPAL